MTFSSHLAHKLAVLPCRRRLALQELLARNGCLGKKDDFKEDGDGDGEDILLKKIVWLLAHDNDEQRQTNTSRNINNNNVNVLWLESVKRVLCLIDGELWVEMLMLLELDGGLGGGGGGGGEFGGANAADTLETPTCTSPTPTPTPTPTPSPSPNTPSSASCSFSFEFGSGGGCGQAAADLDLEAASVSLAETDRPSSPSIRLASPALCIAMRDRPAEMHETIRKNINFFNHLRLDHFNPCSSSSSTWLDFKSLLLTSRDLLNDYEWMEQVKLYFSDSADLEHFKLLVGYNEEVCERIGKSTSYNGKRSGDHSFPSPNLGSTPPSASLQHHRHLSRRHRTPFQYSSRRQITVAERRHLDINALETHAPLFFNLAKAHLLMSESPSSPSSEEVEKEESSYPGIQYQRFIDFLQIDVQDLDDGRWVSFMTHRYFKSSRILRREFGLRERKGGMGGGYLFQLNFFLIFPHPSTIPLYMSSL